MVARTIPLDANWAWKQRDSANVPNVLDELTTPEAASATTREDITKQWTVAQHIPSEVHVELLQHKIIPNPFIGFGEHAVQSLATPNKLLQFDGLDTIVDTYLNGSKIMSTNNGFMRFFYHVPLDTLRPTSNVIFFHFKSAKALAKAEEAKYGASRAGSVNLGDPSRLYIRKPQYDWRWDWGPELMTSGPYRAVSLIVYDARIKDFYPKAFLSPKDLRSSLKLDLTVEGNGAVSVDVLLKTLEGEILKNQTVSINVDQGKSILEWKDINVQPWWPTGHGKQNLYLVEVVLKDLNNVILDSKTKRIGFRSIKLIQDPIQEPDQYGTGTSFTFEVNGRPIFIGGSNWVPGDNFLTTISDERYRSWLTLLKNGNQNMVRIWGGGIYEPDIFYNICDELGILVWLDFQFACGVYPAHDEFVENVRAEATDNVLRVRHHPAMALFCGNNEDYQMILQWGDHDSLPARKLYEDVFPSIVSELTEPEIPYWRGSPYGGKGWDTADPTIGDVHQWHVWGGKELPYQKYDEMGGRFVSEFGMPAFPSMETIKFGCRVPRQISVGFVSDNVEHFLMLCRYHFLQRMMQADAIGYAYRTSGVIVWQLNDCWPVTSWAIADYFLRPKPVYFAIKRELEPITVGLHRTVHKNRANDRPKEFYEFTTFQSTLATVDIWATNSTATSRQVTLAVDFFDLYSEWKVSQPPSTTFSIPPNQSMELSAKLPSFTGHEDATTSFSVVVSSVLRDATTQEIISSAVDFPQPYRYLEWPDPELCVVKPLMGLFLIPEDGKEEGVEWSENCLNLVPGLEKVISVKGLNGRGIRGAWMGCEKGVKVVEGNILNA
ncbi:glycoside hydrolase [Flagelloscypha sp. PMI_526]|nr:glycoside hydrolase [Flagelloscypha sp. PMI_526]